MIILDRAPQGAGAAPRPAAAPSQPAVDQGMGDQEIRVEDIPF